MSLNTATEIVDLCSNLGIKSFTLIGGEPTLYPYFIDIINYIHKNGMRCGFVSNGLKFSDEQFVRELVNCGVKSVSVSLKGENPQTFKEITGSNSFDQVIVGIKNCLKNNIRVSVSMVLTEENIYSFLTGIKLIKDIGVNNFHFSFCYEFNKNENYKDFLLTNNPKRIIKKFIEIYPELDEITEHKFRLSQSFPMCLWDKEFINMLVSKKQITSVCQLLSKSGLLFDTEANIIPCNAMYELKLGKLHEDFNDAKELIEHTKKIEFRSVYNKLCGVPDKKCIDCAELRYCGGGCVCQWTNYSYKQLMEME